MRRSREEWEQHVRRLEQSDLTMAEYATEFGLNARTLGYWKWRLAKAPGRRTKGAAAVEAAMEPTPTFVEVSGPVVWPGTSERIEVCVGDRFVIRVPDQVDADTLRRVLAAVQAAEQTG